MLIFSSHQILQYHKYGWVFRLRFHNISNDYVGSNRCQIHGKLSIVLGKLKCGVKSQGWIGGEAGWASLTHHVTTHIHTLIRLIMKGQTLVQLGSIFG